VNYEDDSQGVVGEGSAAGVIPRVQSGGSMAVEAIKKALLRI
jgi:hypothetical protein